MTSPDNNKSWEAMEEMLHNAEEFYKSLGLGYQVSLKGFGSRLAFLHLLCIDYYTGVLR